MAWYSSVTTHKGLMFEISLSNSLPVIFYYLENKFQALTFKFNKYSLQFWVKIPEFYKKNLLTNLKFLRSVWRWDAPGCPDNK